MTKDIDCALTRADLPDAEAGLRIASELTRVLESLGFHRPRDWKASRTARYGYRHEHDPVDIELLCGDLDFGRLSKRKPAYKLAEMKDRLDFYAAQSLWIDFIDQWEVVKATCGDRQFEVHIPSLAGLAILKLRAIADKINRLEEEKREDQLAFEKLRLQRHATDFALLTQWTEEFAEWSALATLARENPSVAEVARASAIWMFDQPAVSAELDLGTAQAALERLIPA